MEIYAVILLAINYVYPPFQQLYVILPESTPFSHNIPPLFNNYNIMRPSQNLPSLLEYTPLFNNYNIMRRPQNPPSLPEYTPFFNNYNIM